MTHSIRHAINIVLCASMFLYFSQVNHMFGLWLYLIYPTLLAYFVINYRSIKLCENNNEHAPNLTSPDYFYVGFFFFFTTIAYANLVTHGVNSIPRNLMSIVYILLFPAYLFLRWSFRNQKQKEQIVQSHKLTPMSSEEFVKAVEEEVPLDGALKVIVDHIYELENVSQPPKYPLATTELELAKYKDAMAHYVNNAEHTDLVPAMVEAIRPLSKVSEQGIFIAKVPPTLEEAQHLAQRFLHPKYFTRLHRRLMQNHQKAKTVDDYLEGTPLEYLKQRVTAINLDNRFSHTHILGTTGAGKTQLIQYLVTRDLEEDCTVIIIDNQRQMIPKLAKIDVAKQLISPHDDLELNIFDMPSDHTTSTLLKFVLSGLMNAPLTAKQELIFEFSVSLMLAQKGTISDFQDLLEGKEFDLSRVDETTRRFFETEYYRKGKDGYESTRKEISWRIWTLLKNPVLRKMFVASDNKCKLDLSKKLILIDTDVDLLQDASPIFGRFFIAQLLQAAQARFQGTHKPVYVYIDECYYYMDQKLTSMLETARKADIGVTLANQFMAQINEPTVRRAVMALTNTKFASNLDTDDLSQMAQAMRCSKEFIVGQDTGQFALWQNGHDTVSIEVQLGYVEDAVKDAPDYRKSVNYKQDKASDKVNDKPSPLARKLRKWNFDHLWEKRNAVLKELPEDLEDLYSSDKAQDHNLMMRERYSFTEDQHKLYLMISGDVALGLLPVSEIMPMLTNELEIDDQVAFPIAEDMIAWFTPLLDHTQPNWRQSQPKRVPMSNNDDEDIEPTSKL